MMIHFKNKLKIDQAIAGVLAFFVSAVVFLPSRTYAADASFIDSRSGLVFTYAGKASTTAAANDLCKKIPGTVPGNFYLMASLWRSWPAFRDSLGHPISSCVYLAPNQGDPARTTETCISMDRLDYFEMTKAAPVICVATAAQNGEWTDRATGLKWRDAGIVTSQDTAAKACSTIGAGWRLADYSEAFRVARRIQDRGLNPVLHIDSASCFLVNWADVKNPSSPSCFYFDTKSLYQASFPTRALCVSGGK